MSRIFRDILVKVEPEPDAHELLDCMEELSAIHAELGDGHEHSIFAQIYRHLDSTDKFYLTGKMLTPDQGRRIKAILAE